MWHPVLILSIALAAAFLILLTGERRENLRESWTFIAGGIMLYGLFQLLPGVLNGQILRHSVLNVFPNVDIAFWVDPFGLLFAFIAVGLWIPTSLYSIGYMRPLKEHAQTRYFACFAIAISATVGVAFSANLFTLYLFYELLSLSTYPLVAHHQDAQAREGSRKYLTYLLGTSIGLALPAMILVYGLTGTLTFSEMGVFGGGISAGLQVSLLLLFLFGFAKSGLMPFHSWLPGAMVAPTPVSALLHAVAVVKVGVFSVLRVLTGIFGIDLLAGSHLSTIACIIASITLITASLIALTQDSLKRRLAFSTVGQLAYIILGCSVASIVGVQASMLHIAMHAFGKITLFFCAGAIFVATGKKYISQMVGLGKQMPWTMLAFFIGSLSVIGLPPTGGFISKWYLIMGALDADKVWVVVVYLVSSILNAAYFLPIVYRAFFCSDEDSQYKDEVKEAPLPALIPPLLTASGCLLLFYYHDTLFKLAQLAVGG
ncbi:MAG: cation:proton antiporter [Actinobacteria bacterium]|nr:cation:proton antiporter [Actinomycetota bacterium]